MGSLNSASALGVFVIPACVGCQVVAGDGELMMAESQVSDGL